MAESCGAVVSSSGGCETPTNPILAHRLQISNENAQTVARVFVDIGESDSEANPTYRIEHRSLKSETSNGQRNGDVLNDCTLCRRGEPAIDITAGWAETADARFLLAPRTEPRAIKLAFDSLSLLSTAARLISPPKRCSP